MLHSPLQTRRSPLLTVTYTVMHDQHTCNRSSRSAGRLRGGPAAAWPRVPNRARSLGGARPARPDGSRAEVHRRSAAGFGRGRLAAGRACHAALQPREQLLVAEPAAAAGGRGPSAQLLQSVKAAVTQHSPLKHAPPASCAGQSHRRRRRARAAGRRAGGARTAPARTPRGRAASSLARARPAGQRRRGLRARDPPS